MINIKSPSYRPRGHSIAKQIYKEHNKQTGNTEIQTQ